jgi:hypothetical protein
MLGPGSRLHFAQLCAQYKVKMLIVLLVYLLDLDYLLEVLFSCNVQHPFLMYEFRKNNY